MKALLVLVTVASLISGCTATYRITPVDNPPATVRYDHGAPTTSLQQRNGAVQVTPLAYDAHGKMAFAVAADNSANRLVNFGVENIDARSVDRGLRIYTADDLIREARNEAIAAQVALALVGVAAAAASQAAARQTYHSTFYTPRGAYHYKASYYDGAQAAAGTAAAIASTSAGIYAVNRSLDAAIDGIGQSVLQTTTVEPGETVAGRVMVQKPRGRDYPKEITMNVRWNEEIYPFRFSISKSDGKTPPPPIASSSSQVAAPAPLPSSDELPAAWGEKVPEVSAPVAVPDFVPATSPRRATSVPASLPPRVVAFEDESNADREESDEEYNARIWREQAGQGR